MGFWTDKQLLGPNPDDNESRRSSPDKNSVTEEVESGRYNSGPAALVGIRNGGREGIRTPGLLIANSGENKLRQGATIT